MPKLKRIPSNPCAFPQNSTSFSHEKGMSLRDYFAAQVMHYYAAKPVSRIDMADPDAVIRKRANHCYTWADAMLKARES